MHHRHRRRRCLGPHTARHQRRAKSMGVGEVKGGEDRVCRRGVSWAQSGRGRPAFGPTHTSRSPRLNGRRAPQWLLPMPEEAPVIQTGAARRPRSRVDVGVLGVGLDELAAGRHVVAHEHGEDVVAFGGVLNGDLAQACGTPGSWWCPTSCSAFISPKTLVALHVYGGIGSCP